jgi:hypothetical protein
MKAKANFCAVRLQEGTIMSYQDALSSTKDETPPNFWKSDGAFETLL